MASSHLRRFLGQKKNTQRALVFLEESDDLITVVDREGHFIYLNRAALEFFETPPEELIGSPAFDFIHPEDRDATRQAFTAWVAECKASASWENRQVSRSGQVRHVLWSIMPQYDEDGMLSEVWSIGRDISPSKELAHRIQTTLESSIDGYWLVDQEGNLLEVNEAYVRMSGYSRDELLAMRISDLETKEQPEETARRIAAIQENGGDRFESEHRKNNGELLAVEVSVSMLPGTDQLMSVFLRDITWKRRREEHAAAELSTLKSVFDAIDDVIYVADPQTYELLFVNETFRKQWGEDVLGQRCYQVIQGRTESCPFCTNRKIFEELRGQSYVWEFQNEVNGKWYRCIDRAIEWPDGRLVRFELASDITALKTSEAQLRQQKQELEEKVVERTGELQKQSDELSTIIDAIPGLIFYKDTENRYLRVNRFVAEAHRTTKENLVGKSLYDLYPHDQAQAYLDDDLEVVRQGTPKLNIIEPWQTDSGRRWLSTSKIPYLNAQGGISGVIGVAMDITEQKRAEEAVERTARVIAGVNRIFREALTCHTEVDLARGALRVAEDLTQSEFGFIGEVNGKGLFDTLVLSNPGWQVCAIDGEIAPRLIRDMEVRGIWATVIKSGAAQIINAPDEHPERVGLPKGHPPLISFLGVPFDRGEGALGMIALANKAAGYDDDDREAAQAVARAFQEALFRKRLEIQVHKQALQGEARAELSKKMSGDPEIGELGDTVIAFLCDRLGASAGLIYVKDERDVLIPCGRYAYRRDGQNDEEFQVGEGLVGQVARDMKPLYLKDVPEDYFIIGSGLGHTVPRFLYLWPVVQNNLVRAVVELAFLAAPDSADLDLLVAVNESVGSAMESAIARQIQAKLYAESKQMTDELQVQQEELKAANEELADQAERLQESENRLKMQHEELQVTNEELEEKTELLQRQKQDMETARLAISEKAEELELASRYKSEFLANMSHELRTPLNSLLLLARSLSNNKEGTLTADQVESAEVIYQSGKDLLSLINDILDLSKIEAGRMELHFESIKLADLAEAVQATLSRLAEHKGLSFEVRLAEPVPSEIVSDRKRVEQVLRNLVANAIKFTEKGSVRVLFRAASHNHLSSTSSERDGEEIAITVEDTGIGIAPEQQEAIFGAFQQGDGSTARKYGGTGLGLSIVKELIRVLGGKISLFSEPGRGSVFTVLLPVRKPDKPPLAEPHASDQKQVTSGIAEPQPIRERTPGIEDDRERFQTSASRTMLIIEDDQRFAGILAKHCRAKGFNVLLAVTGEEGIELARRYLPQGVILDLKLPGIGGIEVLDLLKSDPVTRHIPVHIASGEERSSEVMHKGAIGYLQKPVSAEQILEVIGKLEENMSRKEKRVLVVDGDEETRQGIVALIADAEILVDQASGGEEAFAALESQSYDCMILDLGLQDLDGSELLKRIKEDLSITVPAVIVYTARGLTWQEELDLRGYSEAIIIKGMRSEERLLDELSIFLHRVNPQTNQQKHKVINKLHDKEALLRGKKVLVVDDDMRTLFALTKILSERGLEVVKAENGEKALQLLEKQPDVDLVLMDIMMPVLDGYETMRRIRAQDRFNATPIIALTAKAMKGDQERCIEAGANDYLAKPIDQERLFSMLKVWLYR